VRTFPGDSTVEVLVAEGQVVAGLAKATRLPQGPILGRGDMAKLDTTGALVIKRDVDVDRLQGWVDGRLRFVAAPLREVLPQLSRWHDIDFEIVDPGIGDRPITIEVADQPLAQVIEAIALLTRTRYERNGRVIRFSALPTPPLVPRAPQ
jgi:transmembrane sensor